MKHIALDDAWRLIDTAPGEDRAETFSAANLDVDRWHAVPVPGDVNAVMVRDGRMPDPHYGNSGRACYWVTARDWWFRLVFPTPTGPGNVADLVFDGLDGHVDLWLNGQPLGLTKNAFRRYRFRVDKRLAGPGQDNVLLLRFNSIDGIMGGARQDELKGWGNRRVLMRKPQFSCGWDWSLPLPSIGILGGVWIEKHDGARFLDVSAKPHVSGRVDFHFRLPEPVPTGYRIDVRVAGRGKPIEKSLTHMHARSYLSVQVPDVELWYPAGMGEPVLYDYEVRLVTDGKEQDRRTGRLGFREVRIVEEPFTEEAGMGLSFWIEVNGKRVFCKGGNWVPLQLWPATATDEQYRFYLDKTVAANFNMQRIWGGGIYERDIFYELCDELGIMVWQDFMFASAGTPVDLMRDEIIAEAEYQVRRLRNHPSLVLWCGINEDVYSWQFHREDDYAPGLQRDPTTPTDATDELVDGSHNDELDGLDRLRDDPQIHSMILRGTVSRLGLGVPFIESSPMSHDDAGNMPNSGNGHISCWKYALFETAGHPERFREHFEKVCSFDSEFCIQGPPSERTMESFLPPAHRWPPDDLWTYHIQRGHRNLPHHEQTLHIAGGLFGPIQSLQDYVKFGQATHAEQMRAEFESARRDRPNNGGTMMWMYNDCWPTANWSIIDYYRRPKPAYYAARRACARHLPIIFERAGQVEFFFSNDTAMPCRVDMRFGHRRLNGDPVFALHRVAECGPCATIKLHAIPRKTLDLQAGDYLFVEAASDDHVLPTVTYFPLLWRNVPWPGPSLRLDAFQCRPYDGGWLTRVQVTTERYARFVHLKLDDRFGAWFDDNFFDLPPEGTHVVTVHSACEVKITDLAIGHWGTPWLSSAFEPVARH